MKDLQIALLRLSSRPEESGCHASRARFP
jgi:hypothetical protein